MDFEQPRRAAHHDEEVLVLGRQPRARARVWGYEGFGPFVFDREAYNDAIDTLMRGAPGGLGQN